MRLFDGSNSVKEKVLASALLGGLIGSVTLNYFYPAITGFGVSLITHTERDSNGTIIKTLEAVQSGKTLWDWLSLLQIPLTLADLAYWFQSLHQKRVDANAKEEELQIYFDRLSTLIIDKNVLALATDSQQTDQGSEHVETEERKKLSAAYKELVNTSNQLIRARTTSLLRRLGNDNQRKAEVIRFLADTEIISRLGLDLSGINLEGVELWGANLARINLRGANLKDANLWFANLEEANLEGANLKGANLEGANLSYADLTDADLANTRLVAANLSYACLISAHGCTDGQLKEAKLCKTALPNGSKLNSHQDKQTFCTTLKSELPGKNAFP